MDYSVRGTVLAFGEMMLRLSPTNNLRIEQATQYDARYGGAEANVAVSLAYQGDSSAYVSVMPANRIGDGAVRTLTTWGVDTSRIVRGGDRLGSYFFEVGASERPNSVVYDRKYSALSLADASVFDWDAILEGVGTFYFSGVTPAVSSAMATACEQALEACRKRGISTVCDLNYRSTMWTSEVAQACMRKLLPLVDVCIANDEDAPSALGIVHGTASLEHGIEEREEYVRTAEDICTRYGCAAVASVIRDIRSVEDSEWMAMLHLADGGTTCFSPVHHVQVLEGVAAGDAFAAGLIHAMLARMAPQEAIDYAIAAGVLKLTIHGDLNLVTEDEIRGVTAKGSGMRVAR